MRQPRVGSSAILAAGMVGGCAALNLAFALWALVTRPSLNSDFRGLWSFARFAHHHVAQIYRTQPLQAFQHQLYPGFQSFFPFQYPPCFLLPIWWMERISFAGSEALWDLAGIAALAAAAWLLFKRSLGWFAVLALLASPASLLNAAGGETGYFTTALLLAGFAWLPKRPWIAGICFGLLICKPQLGVLIPVALLARGDWRAVTSAGCTTLALFALSCMVMPAVLWLDWLRAMLAYEHDYLLSGSALPLFTLVNPASNLIMLGVSPALAWTAQAVISLMSASAVFVAFRSGRYEGAVAALLLGTFLCTPHAYAYDSLPVAAAAMLLWPRAARFGVLLSGLSYLAPLMLLTPARIWFFYTVPEMLLFLYSCHFCLAKMPGAHPDITHEPIPAGGADSARC
jgi:hypothetical protein